MSEITITHQFEVCEKGDTLRKVAVARQSNGITLVKLLTYHEGPDSKPFETAMGLSPEALSLLSRALHEAAHNIDQWKYPTPTPEELA